MSTSTGREITRRIKHIEHGKRRLTPLFISQAEEYIAQARKILGWEENINQPRGARLRTRSHHNRIVNFLKKAND